MMFPERIPQTLLKHDRMDARRNAQNLLVRRHGRADGSVQRKREPRSVLKTSILSTEVCLLV